MGASGSLGLSLTALGMGVVFATLWLLSAMMGLLRLTGRGTRTKAQPAGFGAGARAGAGPAAAEIDAAGVSPAGVRPPAEVATAKEDEEADAEVAALAGALEAFAEETATAGCSRPAAIATAMTDGWVTAGRVQSVSPGQLHTRWEDGR